MMAIFSSPLALLFAAALAFGGIQTWRLDSAQKYISAHQQALAACNANIGVQNQRIEMFKEEAKIMGENLAKRRADATKLRTQGDKKVRAILAAPPLNTCSEALGAAVRDIQARHKDE